MRDLFTTLKQEDINQIPSYVYQKIAAEILNKQRMQDIRHQALRKKISDYELQFKNMEKSIMQNEEENLRLKNEICVLMVQVEFYKRKYSIALNGLRIYNGLKYVDSFFINNSVTRKDFNYLGFPAQIIGTYPLFRPCNQTCLHNNNTQYKSTASISGNVSSDLNCDESDNGGDRANKRKKISTNNITQDKGIINHYGRKFSYEGATLDLNSPFSDFTDKDYKLSATKLGFDSLPGDDMRLSDGKLSSLQEESDLMISDEKPLNEYLHKEIDDNYNQRKSNIFKMLDNINENYGDVNKRESVVKNLHKRIRELNMLIEYLSDNSKKGVKYLDLIDIIHDLAQDNLKLEKELKKVGGVDGNVGEKVEKEVSQRSEEQSAFQTNMHNEELKACRNEVHHVKKRFEEYIKSLDFFSNDLEMLLKDNKNLKAYNSNLLIAIRNKDLEISKLKENKTNYHDFMAKYSKINKELIKSNSTIKSLKEKNKDISKKLYESETRYNMYILKNRDDSVAVLGRELDYIKNIIKKYVSAYDDIVTTYEELSGQYNTVIDNLSNKVLELDEYKEENENLKNWIAERNEKDLEVKSILEEFVEVRNEFESSVKDLEIFSIESIRHLTNTLEVERHNSLLLMNEINEKSYFIEDLINDKKDNTIAYLSQQIDFYKLEVEQLRHKVAELESTVDTSENYDSIMAENENLREYINNFTVEILNKEKIIASLENNESGLKARMASKDRLISKYEVIVSKLKKIKEMYVILKNKVKEQNNQDANQSQGPDDEKSECDNSDILQTK